MIQGVQIYIIRYLCRFKSLIFIIFHTLYKCILNHIFLFAQPSNMLNAIACFYTGNDTTDNYNKSINLSVCISSYGFNLYLFVMSVNSSSIVDPFNFDKDIL